MSIPVVLVHPRDKKCVLTQEELAFVRHLVWEAKSTDAVSTEKNLATLLSSSLKFKSKKAFKLELTALEIDPLSVSVTSRNQVLTAWNIRYMTNLVKCACQHPNSILILPDYIQVSDAAPKPAKAAPRKRSAAKKKKEK